MPSAKPKSSLPKKLSSPARTKKPASKKIVLPSAEIARLATERWEAARIVIPEFPKHEVALLDEPASPPSAHPLNTYASDTFSPTPSRTRSWSSVLLGIVIVLFPFVSWPWTASPLEFPKQTILAVIAIIALLAAIVGVTRRHALTILPKHPVILLGLLSLTAIFLSALRSGARYQGLLGTTGIESVSFLSVLLLSIWVLVIYRTAINARNTLLHALLISGNILSLVTLLSLLGITLYPGIGSSNTVGTTTTASLIAAATLVLGLGELFRARGTRIVLYAALSVIPFIFLLGIGISTAWITVAGGLLMLVLFSFRSSFKARPTPFVVLIILAIIAIVLALYPVRSFVHIPMEVGPSHKETWSIATHVLANSPLLGNGPGNFNAAYLQFRSLPILATPFWNLSFDWGSSALLTTLTTLGWIGAGALLLTLLAVLGSGLRAVLHRKDSEGPLPSLVAVGVTLLLALALAPTPFAVCFLLATVLGMILSATTTPFTTKRGPLTSILQGVFVLLVLLVVVVQGMTVAAETLAARGIAKASTDLPRARTLLTYATYFNPVNDGYLRALSNTSRLMLLDAVSRPRSTQETLLPIVRDLAGEAIASARKATTIAQGNAANWITLGNLYLDLAPVTEGAAKAAVEVFSRAHALSPSDPTVLVSLAQAQNLATKPTPEQPYSPDAMASLQKAATLRPSLTSAHVELARLFANAKKIPEATDAYRAALSSAPSDPELHYEFGLFLMQNDKKDEAQTELEEAVRLAPAFSNARWFLADIYQGNKDFQKALEQIEKVVELNPNNQQAKDRLTQLQKKIK